jgi:hypothetical protein
MDTGTHRRARAVGLGVLLGAGAALACYPLARSTVAAQAVVALGGRPEWLQAALGGPRPQVERLLAAALDDVALQIGGATLLPVDNSQEVLARLDAVARRFPNDPGVRAHQLRHMTRKAVWLKRPEEAQLGRPVVGAAPTAAMRPPSTEALRKFALAAAEGQRLEPENGFFDAMQAAGEFAARQDEEALRDLHAVALKPAWNDHAVEETQSQWKLLQAAYGDRGALQKLPSSWELLLPHYALLRATARMAIWHAVLRERSDDEAGGRAIRGDVMRLGVRMTDGSPMVIGKLVGDAIFQIGVPPLPAVSGRSPASDSSDSRSKAARERYVARLESSGETAEAAWVRDQGERIDAMRAQISRMAEANGFEASLLDAHLQQLQASWLAGMVLLRQIGVLLLVWAAALLLVRASGRGGEARTAWWTWLLVYAGLFLAPSLLVVPFGSSPLLLSAQGVGLALAGTVALMRWVGRRRAAIVEGDRPNGKEYAWQPALVGLIAVLTSTAILTLGWEAIRRDLGGASAMEPFRQLYSLVGVQTTSVLEAALPAVLPAALLVFLVLCRVAALERPLAAGLARGVRRVAPYAVVLLTLLYLGSLVPTVAADRALDHDLVRTTTDELGS